MILKYWDFIKESEEQSGEKPKSKSQLKREEWHRKNPDPQGSILTIDQVKQFGVPDKILDMMKEWPIIYKSPYSKSFYSSSDISWSSKPRDSYRVSDHWNFFTRGSYHCKTDKDVPNNTHYAIGKWNGEDKVYNIILSEPTGAYTTKQEIQRKKLTYLQDPETIHRKRLFKDKFENHQILVDLNIRNHEFSGILHYYNGNKITILKKDFNPQLDLSTQVIYSNGELNPNKVNKLTFTDLDGNILDDPFIIPEL
jgi:hypothetical protein